MYLAFNSLIIKLDDSMQTIYLQNFKVLAAVTLNTLITVVKSFYEKYDWKYLLKKIRSVIGRNVKLIIVGATRAINRC